MSTSSIRLFYVVLSYGRKPATRNILDHPAASGQIANLRLAFPPDKDRRDRFLWDYARKITELNDLPNLKTMLQKAIKLKSGALIVDDFSRLFRLCEESKRRDLLDELSPYGDHIFEVRTGKRLSAFIDIGANDLLIKLANFPPWAPVGARKQNSEAEERSAATEVARVASQKSRKASGVDRDMEIANLRDEMNAEGKSNTAVEVANEANRRLLRTPHKKPWTERSVRDALARFRSRPSVK